MEINLTTHINTIKCSKCTICKKEETEEIDLKTKVSRELPKPEPKLTRLNFRQIDFLN